MLFLGVWWVGKEYADSIKRYFQYKYYHKYVQDGSKKVYQATKTKAIAAHTKARTRAKIVQTRAKAKTASIKAGVKEKLNNRKVLRKKS